MLLPSASLTQCQVYSTEVKTSVVDVVAHVHCHLGIYTSADMKSNCPLFNTLCLIHSQKK